MIGNGVLSDNCLQVTAHGVDLALRLPWYRGLPVSSVEISDVRVNGNVIASEAMALGVNGKDFQLSDLENQFSEVWFVLDDATLHIDVPGAKSGDQYEVELTVTLWPPYLPGLPVPRHVKRTYRAN